MPPAVGPWAVSIPVQTPAGRRWRWFGRLLRDSARGLGTLVLGYALVIIVFA
jgi:hypothetical protein